MKIIPHTGQLPGWTGQILMTREEIATLYEFFKWQYVHYENLPLLKLVKEMREICSETEAK